MNTINIRQYKQQNISWWSINKRTNEYSCSDYCMNICGVEPKDISYDNFILLINPIHHNRFEEFLDKLENSEVFAVTLQLLTKFGYRWANLSCSGMGIDEQGDECLMGMLEFLTDLEVSEACGRDKNMLLSESIERYTAVSDILMELHYQKDISTVINKILNSLLESFKSDRAYLFEYDVENEVQNCIYEVVADGVTRSIDMLQDIPISQTKWFNKMILEHNQSIFCDDIDDLSEEALIEYEILKQQGIRSFMVTPFMNKEGVSGYIGIDVVSRKHIWSDTDKLWFQSLANLTSLCVELTKSEHKAKIEREHYRDLYDNMPIGMVKLKVFYNSQGKAIDYAVLDMNNIACSMYEVKIDELKGKYGTQILSPSKLTIQLEKLDSILKSRKTHIEDIKIEYPNRFLSYTILPVDNDDLVILLQDNTDTINKSRALHKSEETLEHIYNNIPVGIEIYDKHGYLLSLNDVEQEIFGYNSKDDVIGINLFTNPNIPQFFLDDLKDGKSSWCDFYYDFDKLNKYYKSKCTGRKHIVLKGSVLYDVDGNVENYLLIVLDNTDTIKANHKILEFELLFNSIAEFSEVGMSQWYPKNKTMFGTDQWYDNLCCKEFKKEDIMSGYRNVYDDDKVKLRNSFDEMTSGKISSFRQEMRVKDGDKWKWLRANYKVSDKESVDDDIEIIGINIDITEMKNTEHHLIKAKQKAEESDKLKLAFLANMSHEIRTPLNAISGFSDLLMGADDISEREQYGNIIKQNSDLLLQLISDILDLSKIDSGMAELFLEPVNLNGICRDVKMFYQTKSSNEVKFEFEPSAEICMVFSDGKRMTQILSNIVSNAVKFTKRGVITIGYKIGKTEVEIFVRDTGVGIIEEHRKNIFNRFVKLNEFVPGTGLGLSICQRLVEMLGGRIWVESTPGVGSCFYFTQPIERVDGVTQVPKLDVPIIIEDVVKEVEKPVILIAEDTDSNYLLLSTMLKRDYTLYRAKNGKEAVDLFSKCSPSLVLMDIKMPIMDGFEATRQIKKIDSTIPVIMLTAFAYSDDRARAADAGCDGFLTKPVNYKELKEVITNHISK